MGNDLSEGELRRRIYIVRGKILRAFAKLRGDSEAILQLTERVARLEGRLDYRFDSKSTSFQPDNTEAAGKLAISAGRGLRNAPDYTQTSVRQRNQFVIEEIQKAVARYYGISPSDLDSPKRTPSITLPRQICMYLIREITGQNYKSIGALFSRKDHTTVLHACRKIEAHRLDDEETQEALKSIQTLLEHQGIQSQ